MYWHVPVMSSVLRRLLIRTAITVVSDPFVGRPRRDIAERAVRWLRAANLFALGGSIPL